MKLSKFLVRVVLCSNISLLVSCQKDELFNKSIPKTESNVRLSGVVADDPALLSKVPMIISSDFLNQHKNPGSIILVENARPPKEAEKILPHHPLI